MKNILALFCICAVSVVATAQGVNQGLIQSTQFPVNTYMLNPAYAGAEEYTSLQASYKRNWVGSNVGPQTIYLSGHTRLQSEFKNDIVREPRKDGDPNNYALPQRGRSADKYKQLRQAYLDSLKIVQMQDDLAYKKKVDEAREQARYRPYHGVGASVMDEKTGPTARTGILATYAFHFFLNKKFRLSFGASVGLAQHRFDLSDVIFQQQETNIPTGSSSAISPDLSFGTYLYHDNFYAGLSAITILPTTPFKGYVTADNGILPLFMATTGYKIKLNDDLSITPAVWARYSSVFPFGLDFNLRANFKSFWGGVTYRNSDAFAFMAGVNLNKVIDISYAYDLTTSPFKTASSGGHEIVLGYRLQRKKAPLTSRLFN